MTCVRTSGTRFDHLPLSRAILLPKLVAGFADTSKGMHWSKWKGGGATHSLPNPAALYMWAPPLSWRGAWYMPLEQHWRGLTGEWACIADALSGPPESLSATAPTDRLCLSEALLLGFLLSERTVTCVWRISGYQSRAALLRVP